MADPVTKTYLECLGWYVDDVKDHLSNGTLRDPKNNDLTCNNTSYLFGAKAALIDASQVAEILKKFEMLEVIKEDDNDKNLG